METCVLIPKEFSLALANDLNRPHKKEDGDVRISVCSTVFIPAGTLIYPFQGSIRYDKIDLYSLLDDNDVSFYLILQRKKTFLCLGTLFLN